MSHPEDLYQQALAAFREKEYKNAFTHATTAYEAGLHELKLYTLLASSLYQLDRFEEALTWIEKAIAKDPMYCSPDLETHHGNTPYVHGKILSMLQQHEAALEAFNQAIELDPKLVAPWNGKGNALEALHQYEVALEAYEHAIELDPTYAFSWNGKGNALYGLHQHEAALEAFNQAIELDPTSAAPWNGKGNALEALHQYEVALEAYEHAIELDPTYTSPWHGKGNALDSLHQYEAAIEAYDQAIELDPTSAAPWNGKGALWANGVFANNTEVIDLFCAKHQIMGTNPYPLMVKESIDLCWKAISLKVHNSPYWFTHLSIARNLPGARSQAESQYEEGYSPCQYIPFYWHNLATLQLDRWAKRNPSHNTSFPEPKRFQVLHSCFQRARFHGVELNLIASPLDLYFDQLQRLNMAPLWRYRLIQEHNSVEASLSENDPDFTPLQKPSSSYLTGLRSLIELLTSNVSATTNEVELAAIHAALAYHFGDPIEAIKVLDQVGSSRFNSMAAYYYLLAKRTIFLPISDQLERAIAHFSSLAGTHQRLSVKDQYYLSRLYELQAKGDRPKEFFQEQEDPKHYKEEALLHSIDALPVSKKAAHEVDPRKEDHLPSLYQAFHVASYLRNRYGKSSQQFKAYAKLRNQALKALLRKELGFEFSESEGYIYEFALRRKDFLAHQAAASVLSQVIHRLELKPIIQDVKKSLEEGDYQNSLRDVANRITTRTKRKLLEQLLQAKTAYEEASTLFETLFLVSAQADIQAQLAKVIEDDQSTLPGLNLIRDYNLDYGALSSSDSHLNKTIAITKTELSDSKTSIDSLAGFLSYQLYMGRIAVSDYFILMVHSLLKLHGKAYVRLDVEAIKNEVPTILQETVKNVSNSYIPDTLNRLGKASIEALVSRLVELGFEVLKTDNLAGVEDLKHYELFRADFYTRLSKQNLDKIKPIIIGLQQKFRATLDDEM